MAEYKTTIKKYTLSSGFFFEQFYRFKCPKCSSRLKVAASDVGKDDFCPVCRTEFIAPGGTVVDPVPVFEPENELDDAKVIALFESEGLHSQQDSPQSKSSFGGDTFDVNFVLTPADSDVDMFREPLVASLQTYAANTDKPFSEDESTEDSYPKAELKIFRITGVDGHSGQTRIVEVFAENEQSANKRAKKSNVFPTSIDAIPEHIEGTVRSAAVPHPSPKTVPSLPEKRSEKFGSDPDTEVNCPECQKLISIRARRCPYCRSAVNENREFKKISLIVFVIAALLMGVGAYLSNQADQNLNRERKREIDKTARELQRTLDMLKN